MKTLNERHFLTTFRIFRKNSSSFIPPGSLLKVPSVAITLKSKSKTLKTVEINAA